jgi:hypothetical protein
VRQVRFAVHKIVRSGETAPGLNWLKTEVADYWSHREKILHIADFLSKLDSVAGIERWRSDCEAARLLAGAVRNDHV